jgi:hypothetical protein
MRATSRHASTATPGALCAHKAQPVAAFRSTPGWRILAVMGTKSRQSISGSSVRHSAERAAEARKEADRLACVAWNQRMLGYKEPAQPSPALGDALNAGIISRCGAWATTMAPLTVTAIDLATVRIFARLCELNRPTCGSG